ncbi:hypothetical protein [Clostridium sp. YIM B02500]|uniref:hypothetical protein n=1 Tax=Clostridium sp. YIM B02500 TaxID=2910681 RepID=UPI001EED2C69|nr:hypothetical protein [Clostridium sp. YIM B02500]
MCTKNITISSKNMNFIITNTILSMQDFFTFDQVIDRLREYSIDNEKVIKKSIARLRDNDYLEEDGSYYRVLDSRESNRWGIF